MTNLGPPPHLYCPSWPRVPAAVSWVDCCSRGEEVEAFGWTFFERRTEKEAAVHSWEAPMLVGSKRHAESEGLS
jgi:hypothetical protein